MLFDVKLLIRLVYRSLFKTRGTNVRLTQRRVAALILCVLLYPGIEITNWICLALDNIFFRGYRTQPVEAPAFILGPARSGTTFLYRLLSGDKERFTSMTLAEMIFAPSVMQKILWSALGWLDKQAGSPLYKTVRTLDKKLFSHVNAVHKLSLFEPEEDDFILLHIFSSAFLMYVFPFEDELRSLLFFDDLLPRKKRRAIMTFYRQCIQRHLYVFGKHKHYLSKNPYFSSRIQSIDETFPDAMIICLLRTPIKVLPSMLSMIQVGCRQFMSPLDSYPMRDLVVQLVADWYRRPLSYVQRMPAERYVIVQYDSLAEDPAQSVKRIYGHFGLDLTACFCHLLEQTKTSSYSSRHAYSIEQTGLSPEQIIADYQDIFKRLQYKTINDLK